MSSSPEHRSGGRAGSRVLGALAAVIGATRDALATPPADVLASEPQRTAVLAAGLVVDGRPHPSPLLDDSPTTRSATLVKLGSLRQALDAAEGTAVHPGVGPTMRTRSCSTRAARPPRPAVPWPPRSSRVDRPARTSRRWSRPRRRPHRVGRSGRRGRSGDVAPPGRDFSPQRTDHRPAARGRRPRTGRLARRGHQPDRRGPAAPGRRPLDHDPQRRQRVPHDTRTTALESGWPTRTPTVPRRPGRPNPGRRPQRTYSPPPGGETSQYG
jgi:hypothetical protein